MQSTTELPSKMKHVSCI